MATSLYKILAFGALLLVCMKAVTQTLPELTFQNIELWADRYGAIQVIEDSEGYLWMTSALGVHRYDGKRVHSYYHQPDSISISGNYTELLFEDDDKNIWIGTTSGAIERYVRDLDHFLRVIPPSSGIGHAVRMIQDHEGMLWIVGANGLFSIDPHSLVVTRYIPDTPPKDKGGYGFRGVALDKRDMQGLWVAGLDGAYYFDKMTHKFESLDVPERGNGLYMLMDIHQPSPNELWCASWFGGLMSYDLSSREWTNHFPKDLRDGRWYDVIKGTLPFDQQHLWVAGGAGFGMFDQSTRAFEFYPFDQNDPGNIDSSFSYAGICTTRQGNVVVTRLTGFSISSSLNHAAGELKFDPVIHSIEIEGEQMMSDTISSRMYYLYLDELKKNISFSLSTPGNYASEPVKFSYQLMGYDKDWQELHDGQTVRYTNLPRGNYQFQYRARLGDQDWRYGKALTVEKEVLFYQRAWFVIASGSLLMGLILLFYRLRVQRIRQEEKLKTEFNKKLADTEMAALRSQMNPHFMFNSLNSIKYYILNEETDNANKYLTKFSKLMRLVLKNSQSKLINLAEEMEALKLYIELESLRFKEDFQYAIDIDESIDEEDTFVPPLLIQPYVENAIWHGLLQKNAPGKLQLTIGRRNGYVHVEVSDDGIGREAAEALRSKSATNKSFGTKITKDRIALVREIMGIDASVKTYDLRNDDGVAIGTRVVIEMPYISGDKIEQLGLGV